jgi:hypothetical protein
MSVPDYPLAAVLDFKFTSRSFATGIPTTLAGTPTCEVFKDNNTTEVQTGIAPTVDFDGVTGLNNIRITASSGNGYATGESYSVVMEAGTVGGVSVVGEVVAQFSINRSPALRPTTAGRTLDIQATGEVDANLTMILATALTETATQLAGAFVKFFDVPTPTGTVNSLPDAVPGAAGGGFIAGTNAATTVTTSFTATFTGNLSGSVGSIGTGGIVAASFAAGAINAAALGADCITAAKIADDAFVAANFAASSLNGKGDWNTVTPDASGVATALHAITDALVVGISNVTRLSVAIPKYLERPSAGNKAIKIEVALKDTNGNMEDPDGPQLALTLYNSEGTSRDTLLYKEYALTNVLDAATGIFSAYKDLERSATGLYFCYLKVASDATEEELVLKFGWEEDSAALYEFRASQVTDAANDLGVLLARLTAARSGYLDNLNGHTPQTGDNYARLGAPAGASHAADIADLPTVAEFEVRTILATAYFDPAADTVANVTAVGSVTTKTGYSLGSTGLNLVLVDGETLPSALQIIAASVIGKISGAGTATEIFVGLDGNTTRATVTVDVDGNRTNVVYV